MTNTRYSENKITRQAGTATGEKTLLIGAHFDTVEVAPGADDNASGVAAMLEVARVLRNVQPLISIEFVAFALEEGAVGLFGSTQYAQAAKEKGRDLLGVINLDTIGYFDAQPNTQFPFFSVPGCLSVTEENRNTADFIAAVGNDASASLIVSFQQAAARYVTPLATAGAQVAGNGECFEDLRRSDHAPFWDAGYQAMMITDTANFRNPYYHSADDLPSTVDLDFVRRISQAVLATAVASTQVPEAGSLLLFGLAVMLTSLCRPRRGFPPASS
jgi:Zn-dependent M28 family amino/carboxypeptidase